MVLLPLQGGNTAWFGVAPAVVPLASVILSVTSTAVPMADPCVPGLCLPSIFFVAAGQAGRCSPRHVLFHCSEVFNATPLTEFIKREDRRDAEVKRRANKPPLDTERAAHALADDTCAESRRLADSEARVADWKKWGCVLGSDVAGLCVLSRKVTSHHSLPLAGRS